MKRTRNIRISLAACAIVLPLLALSGCAKHGNMDQATIDAHMAAKRAGQGGGAPSQPK